MGISFVLFLFKPSLYTTRCLPSLVRFVDSVLLATYVLTVSHAIVSELLYTIAWPFATGAVLMYTAGVFAPSFGDHSEWITNYCRLMILLDPRVNDTDRFFCTVSNPIVVYYAICGYIGLIFVTAIAFSIAQGAVIEQFTNSVSAHSVDWNAYNLIFELGLAFNCVWCFYVLISFVFIGVALGHFAIVLHRKVKHDSQTRRSSDLDVDIKLLVVKVRACCCR